MYKAEDIRNVEFTKVKNGYSEEEVDAFRDSCADTVKALEAEIGELKMKMGILANKINEDKDSISKALLTAQRMGDSIVNDANAEAEKIVAAAKKEADDVAYSMKNKISLYEAEMERMKREISDFKANMLSLYKDHLALLKSIPDVRREEVVAKQEEPAPVEPVKEEVVAEEPVKEEPVKIFEEEPATMVIPPVEAKPRSSKFANLKFGEDYDMKED